MGDFYSMICIVLYIPQASSGHRTQVPISRSFSRYHSSRTSGKLYRCNVKETGNPAVIVLKIFVFGSIHKIRVVNKKRIHSLCFEKEIHVQVIGKDFLDYTWHSNIDIGLFQTQCYCKPLKEIRV